MLELAVGLGQGCVSAFPRKRVVHSAKPVCKAFSVSELNCIFGVYHMVCIKKFTSDLLNGRFHGYFQLLSRKTLLLVATRWHWPQSYSIRCVF